jgi:hypothetical protein
MILPGGDGFTANDSGVVEGGGSLGFHMSLDTVFGGQRASG